VSEILRDRYFAAWLPPGLQNPIPLEWTPDPGMQNLLHRTFLIPNVVPRGFYPTWTSRNGAAPNQTGLVESTPFRIEGRSWVMAFAYGGDPGSIHISVLSQDPKSTRNLDVSSYPTETWDEWMIKGTDREVVLEVSVTDPNSWIAFSGFRFASSGYALVSWLRKNTVVIWVVLATGVALLVASPFVANRKERLHSAREMTPSPLTRSKSRTSGA
jgi:hypothetical protein